MTLTARVLRIAALLALGAAWTTGAASAASAQTALRGGTGLGRSGIRRDSTYVEAVIQLDVENGPSAVLPALIYNTKLLLPLRQFFTLVEIHIDTIIAPDSAVAVLEPDHVALRFVPRARVLTRGGSVIAYDTVDVVWAEGDLFVATGLLDRLLGVATSVEWSNLSAMVGQSGGLPVVVRTRREWRHQMLYQRPQAMAGLDMPLQQHTLDGSVLTWSLTAATAGPTNQMSLDLGLGTGLLGGSAEVRPQFFNSGGVSGSDVRVSWSKTYAGSRWLRQIRVGDAYTSGRRATLVQGLVVTNAPFIRSSEFDVEQFVTNVPSGWEAELYNGSRLLGFSDAAAGGAFRLPVPLSYGQNPFDMVMYGPGGQMVRQRFTIRVPSSRLSGGRFEYAFAAGRCRFDPCNGLVSADARYGLSNAVTLQAGSDMFFQGALGTLWQPYAIVSAAPIPALGLTGEAVLNGHLSATADYEPNTDLQASVTYSSLAESGSLFSGNLAETRRSEGSLFWRPGWMNGLLFFQGTAALSSGPTLRQSAERFSATTRVRQVRYSLGVVHNVLAIGSPMDAARWNLDASADAILMGPWKWLRASSLRGEIAVAPSQGLELLHTSLGRNIGRGFRVDAGIGWYRGTGFALDLSLSTSRPGPRFGARSRVAGANGSQALMYANGSMAYDPRSRLLRLGDGADLGRAGISGMLFRDDNGNGRQDPGEPGLAGVPVRVGGWPAETDAEGRFSVWGLVPSEPIEVEVDTLAFGDPHLVLPAAVLRVRPSPNTFGTIAVPVVTGAEVGGYVTLGDAPLSGVTVVMRELNTGVEVTTVTFSDGAFYRGAVPPGEYEVTLPDAVLRRLAATASPLSIFIPPGPGEKRFDDLQLRLSH